MSFDISFNSCIIENALNARASCGDRRPSRDFEQWVQHEINGDGSMTDTEQLLKFVLDSLK